jgi:hypothetical protein
MAEVKAAMGPAEDNIMERHREKRGKLQFFYDWKKKKLDHVKAAKGEREHAF